MKIDRYMVAGIAFVAIGLYAFYAFANPPAYPGGGHGRYAQTEVQFCGEQGNATETFGGPNLTSYLRTEAAFEVMTLGGTLCNALGDTTVGAVDNDISVEVGYVVSGMYCRLNATPASGTTTLVLYDDTVATLITCGIATGGAVECASEAGIVHRVAANSQVAIGSTPAGNDSTDDFKCMLYVSWE